MKKINEKRYSEPTLCVEIENETIEIEFDRPKVAVFNEDPEAFDHAFDKAMEIIEKRELDDMEHVKFYVYMHDRLHDSYPVFLEGKCRVFELREKYREMSSKSQNQLSVI